MEKKQCLLSRLSIIVLSAAVLFMNTSMLHAGNIKFTKKPGISSSSMTIVKKPDLVIKKASWSKLITQGDIVGSSSILNITVLNKGNVAAGASKLKIDCKSLTSTNYPYPLAGMINVQPLGPGQSMTYAWPSSSSEKWFSGTYRLTFTADWHFNSVEESNENNNTKILTFTVKSKMKKVEIKKIDLKGKIQTKPAKQFKIADDLEIVSISMTPTNPVAGEIVEFVALIRNSGKTKTPRVGSLFTFWDTKGGAADGGLFSVISPSIPSLFTGQTYKLRATTQFITLGDSAGVSVEIDPQNEFKETNENNNKKSLLQKL